MQAESRIAVSFPVEDSAENYQFPETQNYDYFTQTTGTLDQPIGVSEAAQSAQPVAGKPRESKLDLVSASIVYGLTAMFMAFIFGYVTDYIPLLDNSLLSIFMGVCISVIAYALMKGED